MKHLTIIIGLLFFSLFATMQRAGAQRQDSAAAEQKDRPYPSVHYLAEPCGGATASKCVFRARWPDGSKVRNRCISFPYIFRAAIPSAIRKSDILPLRKRNTTNDGRPCRIRKRTGLFAFSTARGIAKSTTGRVCSSRKLLRGAYNCNSSCIPAAKSTCWLRKQSPFRSVPSRCPIRSIRPLRACCHFR